MRLDMLITKRYPPEDLYMPEVRTERDPWTEPPYIPPPYTPFLHDVIIQGENMIENVNRRHAAGFPARMRLGQHLQNDRGLGTRVSPLNMPEAQRGTLVAVSI